MTPVLLLFLIAMNIAYYFVWSKKQRVSSLHLTDLTGTGSQPYAASMIEFRLL